MNHLDSLRDVSPVPFWLDDPDRPQATPALVGDTACDLLVVGGGYTGLWTALVAKERDPSMDVVLIEADEAGGAASGRNGGFCESSLTHGLANGLQRWPEEIGLLERLGRENLQAIEDTIERHGIDCSWERTGSLVVATEPYQVEGLKEEAETLARFGANPVLLDAEAVRAEIDSPTFLGGVWNKDDVAMVNPARLAWGLKRACLDLGVRVHERTPATSLREQGDVIVVRTAYGRITARRTALATNAYPSLLRRHRPYTVPVYDYALMTEPLTEQQLAAVGWRNRQGFADCSNEFHYVRLSADNRILWGGYDAVYHRDGEVSAEHDQRPETFATLARHFFTSFPQLEGIRFTHAWGGAIDTSTRFCVFFDTSHHGKVAYAAGFTGLGVGATRFGAEVMLDLLAGERTERTRLELVRRKPLPFPPDPIRSAGIGITKWSMRRADRNEGRRNLWLRTLDRFGLGFDS
ncbi:FAD-binding oxidoreductase [Streptomyces sp. NBC_01260]|uniref:NAD(P)/FAD-dependent oxidoreductase n=1 Tax=unclassified Streptomyces TaxID=2593676 RepID=UPI000F48130F|nr:MULTISPECIES: FAD-dependent oxidoreductase [unclassified Streptomyces]MCX4774143.1 FAD-binding oxidoreductase [Streptomyces sp. NBC_01285]ROQ73396.1 glycine/D-amino acid oxidase-like deaminating enzyme [Streptomyces sp. CEV 2-1]